MHTQDMNDTPDQSIELIPTALRYTWMAPKDMPIFFNCLNFNYP